MIDLHKDTGYTFGDLVEIMRILRSADGCPWDREQTHASIRPNVLEEAYELSEAIELDDPGLMSEELGDVLLQVVFHAQMAGEAGRFDIGGVLDGICLKLIERHPHIFGDIKVSGPDEVLRNWEQIKSKTKGQTTKADSLKAVSGALPALMMAEKLVSRAAKAGFPLESSGDVSGERELGNALLALVVSARRAGVNPELALLDRCRAFIGEFEDWELGRPG